MATDWAAISGFGVGGLTLAVSWVASRKGEKASDRDNRFEVLSATVDQLQEETRACRDREAAAEARYRLQDDDLNTLRDRHRESLTTIDDLHEQLRVERQAAAQRERELQAKLDAYEKGSTPP